MMDEPKAENVPEVFRMPEVHTEVKGVMSRVYFSQNLYRSSSLRSSVLQIINCHKNEVCPYDAEYVSLKDPYHDKPTYTQVARTDKPYFP